MKLCACAEMRCCTGKTGIWLSPTSSGNRGWTVNVIKMEDTTAYWKLKETIQWDQNWGKAHIALGGWCLPEYKQIGHQSDWPKSSTVLRVYGANRRRYMCIFWGSWDPVNRYITIFGDLPRHVYYYILCLQWITQVCRKCFINTLSLKEQEN